MVSEGIAKGYVRPLSRVIYEATEAARAFHLLASSRHRGRVLLRLHGNRLAVTPKYVHTIDSSQHQYVVTIICVMLLNMVCLLFLTRKRFTFGILNFNPFVQAHCVIYWKSLST